MLTTTRESGIDPGLNVNLDWQSLSFASELSDPLQSHAPPSGSSFSPLPPERVSRQWLQQLGTTDDDSVSDIATDSSGNIYMVGSTTGELFIDWGMDRSDLDGWLAKFNSNGTLLWGKQILTPADDVASQVAVDSSGNVYVAGNTRGNLGGNNISRYPDIWLAKYDSSGTQLWIQQNNIIGWDTVSDLEVDRQGRVYLTGQGYGKESVGLGFGSWVSQYSGDGTRTWSQPFSIGFYTHNKDIASGGIAIDPSNNVYVVLKVSSWRKHSQSVDFDLTSSDLDFSNYWNNGIWHWGIEEDGMGSLVSKHDPSGNLIWQKYLPSAEWGSDYIAADDFGNFYLRGNSEIFKYDRNGELLWQQDFTTTQTATDITVDEQGNAYLSGWSDNDDVWMAKYNSNGTLAWEEEFGTPESDRMGAIAVDSTGKVYLAGSTRGALGQANAGGEDIWLAQYLQIPGDPNHAPESLRFSLDRIRYKATDTLNLKNGWVQDLDGASDLGWIDLQLIYSSGMTRDLGSITNFTPVSWSPDWAAFNHNLNLSDLLEGTYRLSAIAYDLAGAASSAFERKFLIYSNTAPERLQFSLTSNQYEVNETLTLKNAWVYDKDGSQDLAYIDFELIDETGNAIDVNDTSQFVPATWSHQWANFDYSLDLGLWGLNSGIYTLRGTAYDRAGLQGSSFARQFELTAPSATSFAWMRNVDIGGLDGRSTDMAIDRFNNLYLTGGTRVAKYNDNGDRLWGRKVDAYSDGIAVDDWGDVYLTGSVREMNTTRSDIWFAKYDSTGNFVWHREWGTDETDLSYGIVVDRDRNTYLLGQTGSGVTSYWLAKYEKKT